MVLYATTSMPFQAKDCLQKLIYSVSKKIENLFISAILQNFLLW